MGLVDSELAADSGAEEGEVQMGLLRLVTAVCRMLMYYVDIFALIENPERTWERINVGRCNNLAGQLVMTFQ